MNRIKPNTPRLELIPFKNFDLELKLDLNFFTSSSSV